MNASMREILRWVKELLLRPSGNEALILLSCILGLRFTKDTNFIFSPQIFSSSTFTSPSNGVSYLALINRFGGPKMHCS